ncbi:tyrosine--tRNA ligase [Candidatus Kaiserbacteria bacterium RIFCSPLOWO2_02_FULL_45_11b]|uniref:Tyrosine--tRNA ligase n=1 Tax=Candidatus Kaiserbacteria bacterium RIFCSPLOWO2_12_FULL_45_26 TaxID=1798525 RepID=A0A1F6FGZ7_9BACT|nr:MAG: tyrosine--tRNA ligase [Candidatus Kaiserbacteria bacterium RIFCSPLOWO2_01_FULL_45_25]OGG81525.1 MAG: tyrosine--tRNA ligase [Candidatus Kaiserbacteria bacterium RIFCSPLOWO2_02_FULL_45_11b]OGG85116.1 MAG: tyrosine--tRNA ligase [Candidatus Kaiserbacteria bacterium RIFCSPLOWO2_12_FULL_45_26]
MNINTDPAKIEDILTRSVEEILPSKDEFRTVLQSGKRLRIYIGTDATGSSLHLGHATNYMILEKLRQLGHEVIFLIGDFTSRIGDPTDKNDSARKQLTREEVVENTTTWLKQVAPVIDINNAENPVVLKYNHDWLAALTFEDIINLSSNFTVQQMIERDMFQKRIASGKPLYMHELFYPLMQGYDSVAMDVDVEMCGTDQKFNALAGRTLLRKLKDKEKFVFITRLLENPITGEKMMSKSLGTGVFLDFDANRMYGALMAQADENMRQLFEDCTWLTIPEIDTLLSELGPRDAKMRLAFTITEIYHGSEAAKVAEDAFVKTFQNKEVPDDIPEMHPAPESSIVDILVETSIATSKSDARRAIEQGAVKLDGRKVDIAEADRPIGTITTKVILQKGKRHFIALI